MKLKPGTTYATRNGRKAIIYAVNMPNKLQMQRTHGALEYSDGSWRLTTWSNEGLYYYDVPSGKDIACTWSNRSICSECGTNLNSL